MDVSILSFCRALVAILVLYGKHGVEAVTRAGGVRWTGHLLAALRSAGIERDAARERAKQEEDEAQNLTDADEAERDARYKAKSSLLCLFACNPTVPSPREFITCREQQAQKEQALAVRCSV
eukprot:SAG31_NODE_152_length_22216_cov_16.550029_9_plen_122_part_00